MDNTLELSRWREAPRSLLYRRWTIASLGLRQLQGGRFFRLLMLLAWTTGLLMAVVVFTFTQSLASGGWLESYAQQLGPRPGAIARAFGALVLLYPDVCIGGLFTLLFWLQSSVGLGLCLLALTLIIPGLVTRDHRSNALTLYLSRPLTSTDYLLGKLGTIAAVLVLLWTGPLLVGWLGSLVLSPTPDVFRYSIGPLADALLFNGIALVVLGALALGVSASSSSSRVTIALWLGLWLVLGSLASPPGAPGFIRHSSFSYNLDQVRREIFQPGKALQRTASDLPLLNQEFTDTLKQAGDHLQARHATGSYLGLGILVLLASTVFFRRLRPE